MKTMKTHQICHNHFNPVTDKKHKFRSLPTLNLSRNVKSYKEVTFELCIKVINCFYPYRFG